MSQFGVQNSAEPVKGLDDAERAVRGHGMPPVEQWNPPFQGNIDMRIAVDGTWFYQGSPITRDRLVRLFSTVLRRDEDGGYCLVTPVEMVGITVDDAPFVAVRMTVCGIAHEQTITLETNVGDTVVIDADHPMRFAAGSGDHGPTPYVQIRGRLEARVNRALFYDLVELGVEEHIDGRDLFGVWSSGQFFAMAPASEVAV